MNFKHSNVSGTLQHGEEHPQYMIIMVNSQYKAHDENESQAKMKRRMTYWLAAVQN